MKNPEIKEVPGGRFGWVLPILRHGVTGIVTAAVAAYIGAQHASTVKSLEYNLVHGHQRAAPGFHQDGFDVYVDNPVNEKGQFETFLTYDQTKIPVLEDLLPDTDTMLAGIAKRLQNNTPQENIQLNYHINAVQKQLYGTVDLPPASVNPIDLELALSPEKCTVSYKGKEITKQQLDGLARDPNAKSTDTYHTLEPLPAMKASVLPEPNNNLIYGGAAAAATLAAAGIYVRRRHVKNYNSRRETH